MDVELTLDTTEKVVSLIVGCLAIASYLFVKNKVSGSKSSPEVLPVSTGGEVHNSLQNSNTNNLTVNVSPAAESVADSSPKTADAIFDISALKRKIKILFIDDDQGFKIVGILKKMGWENTRIVEDINSLEEAVLSDADVVFVDIQGVGKSMFYVDEGLGLALAIKRRYQKKKIIIYSAEEEGARFHDALQEADYSLPKTAEPIRFEETIVRVLKNG